MERSKEGKQDGERKVGGDIVHVCPPLSSLTLRPASLRVMQQTSLSATWTLLTKIVLQETMQSINP